MELINNEKQFMHNVLYDSKFYDYLKEQLVLSYRQTNAFMKSSCLMVNKEVIHDNIKIQKGDLITLIFEDEDHGYEKERIDLDIVYETDDLLIINKRPHMLVHPTKTYVNHTYANAIAFYFDSIGLKRKIRFVNRLDRDTSGLLIIAKNSYSHSFLAKQMENNEVIKKYLAVTTGHFEKMQGVIHTNIQKLDEKYVVYESGKESETHYRVLNDQNGIALVECILKSGRTHQIRVHLGSIGHFILGDEFYYKKDEKINRQALHAYELTFIEPRTFQTMTISCELPEDMKLLLI